MEILFGTLMALMMIMIFAVIAIILVCITDDDQQNQPQQQQPTPQPAPQQPAPQPQPAPQQQPQQQPTTDDFFSRLGSFLKKHWKVTVFILVAFLCVICHNAMYETMKAITIALIGMLCLLGLLKFTKVKAINKAFDFILKWTLICAVGFGLCALLNNILK